MQNDSVLKSSLATNQSKIQSSLFCTNPLLKTYGQPRVHTGNTVRMSHFTSVTTKLTDPKILKKSLEDLKVPLTVAEEG